MNLDELKKTAEIANAVIGDINVEMTIASESGPNQAEIDAVTSFMAMATPAAVLALIAENDRLRTAEGDAMTYKAGMENVAQQRDQLRAENERLRKLPTCWSEVLEQSEANDELLNKVLELSQDAERWRYARDRLQSLSLTANPQHESIAIGHDKWIDSRMGKQADQ